MLEGVEKREPPYTVGGNINWCSHHGKQYRSSLKKLKIDFPCDPPIPLLGIYPDKTIIQKDTCTHLFIAALSAIAKTWKQPKCPLILEWIKKMWDVYYTVEYYSATKNEIMTFAAAWMDLEIIIVSKVSHTKKDKYHMI